MERKQGFFLLIIYILTPYLLPQFHGSQTRVPNRLYVGISSNKATIDKRNFHASLLKGLENVNTERIYSQAGMRENDIIDKLPGQPPVGFDQYGGYVTVDQAAGRALYYYFVEAQRSKESLPLLLWLNGGPGCSSLGYGAMEEIGPFRVHSDGKTLYKNRYSWNYAANVLFLESPAGVGFSYSNRTSDYSESGDRRTTEDNYVFLLNWLERFPEYKDRDFYIAGESYAGHYVPQLVHTILYQHKAKGAIINLKGIIIGNAWINYETDTKGIFDYYVTHALISEDTGRKIQGYCDFSTNANIDDQPPKCLEAISEANRDIGYLDIYNIYAPLCTASNLTFKPKKASIKDFDPCTDYYVDGYLNWAEVQEAMHANVTKLNYKWTLCSDVIFHIWRDSPSTILPLLKELMAQGLRVWLYSGDTDGCVPFTSTKYSINTMNLSIETAWHPWFFLGEVGGYTQVYKENLTFATVRDAGHDVPSYKPGQAFSVIKHFLDGTSLSDLSDMA